MTDQKLDLCKWEICTDTFIHICKSTFIFEARSTKKNKKKNNNCIVGELYIRVAVMFQVQHFNHWLPLISSFLKNYFP